MKRPLVAIFGCGPAGLLAAHACENYGLPFAIFSKKVKSPLGGAQFSHIAIPRLTSEEPEAMLTYRVEGTPEEYRRKVYGNTKVPFVSVEHVRDGKEVPAWNLRGLYDRLWSKYENRIIDIEVDFHMMATFDHGAEFDLVFNSIPLKPLCRSSWDFLAQPAHLFQSQTIRLLNFPMWDDMPNNTIFYDGTEEHSYYRMSKIFGVGTTEWGANSPLPPIDGIKLIPKPIATNCDCHPRVIRIGRFGSWSKGELTFHAYNRVIDTIEGLGADL